jgi:hypothetical protein
MEDKMERPRVFGSEFSATELADKFLDLWEEAHSKKHDHQWLKMRYRCFPIHNEDAVREASPSAARRGGGQTR